MKAGREHRIPLSEPALAILGRLLPLKAGTDGLVFPSNRTRTKLSDMALSMLVRGMNEADEGQTTPWLASDGRPVVVHGFRSTFRDWCEEATSTPVSDSPLSLFLTTYSLTLGNPKPILFFVALLPSILDLNQLTFVDFLTVALVIAIVIAATLAAYAMAASKARSLFASALARRRINRVTGTVLAFAAVVIALR